MTASCRMKMRFPPADIHSLSLRFGNGACGALLLRFKIGKDDCIRYTAGYSLFLIQGNTA